MSYGLPYKGSKSRIANELIACLPNAENFYDMFVGGGRLLIGRCWREDGETYLSTTSTR